MPKKNIKFVEIILTSDVEKLGKKGEIKTVRLGYFSNFLLPSGLAKIATSVEKEKQAAIVQEKAATKVEKKSAKEQKKLVLAQKRVKAKKAIKKIVKKKK
jgi:large subunit ribosomal protein L9